MKKRQTRTFQYSPFTSQGQKPLYNKNKHALNHSFPQNMQQDDQQYSGVRTRRRRKQYEQQHIIKQQFLEIGNDHNNQNQYQPSKKYNYQNVPTYSNRYNYQQLPQESKFSYYRSQQQQQDFKPKRLKKVGKKSENKTVINISSDSQGQGLIKTKVQTRNGQKPRYNKQKTQFNFQKFTYSYNRKLLQSEQRKENINQKLLKKYQQKYSDFIQNDENKSLNQRQIKNNRHQYSLQYSSSKHQISKYQQVCKKVQYEVFEDYKRRTIYSLQTLQRGGYQSDCSKIIIKQFTDSLTNCIKMSIGQTATKCQVPLAQVIFALQAPYN